MKNNRSNRSCARVICELNEFGLEQMGHDEALLRALMQRFGFTAPEVERAGGVGNLIFKKVLSASEVKK